MANNRRIAAAQALCTKKRNRGDNPARSSHNPKPDIASAKRGTVQTKPAKKTSPATRKAQLVSERTTAATIAIPPIRVVGVECELRSLGTSMVPTIWATRMVTQTPAADTARERAATPKVIGPNACTTPRSFLSPR